MREQAKATPTANVKRFLPDDAATPNDIAAIQAASAEYAHGETVTHDAIDWN